MVGMKASAVLCVLLFDKPVFVLTVEIILFCVTESF
jgi:hypothetical protein